MIRSIFSASLLAAVAVAVTLPMPASATPLPAPGPSTLVRWHHAAIPSGVDPDEMTIAHDDVVWFSQDPGAGAPELVAFDPSTGLSRRYPDGRVGRPDSIVEASDGKIWFSESGSATVRRLDPVTGLITDIILPTSVRPQTLTAGDDGAVWFGTNLIGKIGRVGLDDISASIVDYGGAGAGEPKLIVQGPDGRIWVAESTAQSVDAYDPATGLTESYVVTGDWDLGMTSGPDGHLWLSRGVDIVRLSTTGTEEVFSLPSGRRTAALAIDSNSRGVYIATQLEIYSISSDGTFTRIVPDTSTFSIADLEVSADGYLWYRDASAGAPLTFG